MKKSIAMVAAGFFGIQILLFIVAHAAGERADGNVFQWMLETGVIS